MDKQGDDALESERILQDTLNEDNIIVRQGIPSGRSAGDGNRNQDQDIYIEMIY